MKNVKRGELYYAQLPINVGSEQSGKRPVVIIQNDKGNEYSPTTIVALITSKLKKHLPTHVQITNRALPYNSIILAEQVRTIDKSRLDNYIGRVSNKEMICIDKALSISLALQNEVRNDER